MLPMMARELNLTDAQRAQIKAIADAHRDEWKALFDRERAARMALNEAVTADAVDEGLVRQRSGELAMIDADVAVARAHAYAQFVQILTPQQRATLKDARARRQGHRG
jgi:protein CpxP